MTLDANALEDMMSHIYLRRPTGNCQQGGFVCAVKMADALIKYKWSVTQYIN